MAKSKNQRIYSDPEHLKMLAEEQKEYIGREYRLDLENGCLTIFALPRRHKKSKDTRPKQERDKRKEKFERRA
jgi:hypothetical protein